jgi:hypothetical protein
VRRTAGRHVEFAFRGHIGTPKYRRGDIADTRCFVPPTSSRAKATDIVDVTTCTRSGQSAAERRILKVSRAAAPSLDAMLR